MVKNKDIDALLGKGEALLAREEWEKAVRTFERAWEARGGGNKEVCPPLISIAKRADIRELFRFTHGCQGPPPVEAVEE